MRLMYSLRVGRLSTLALFPSRSWDVHFGDRTFQLQNDPKELTQVIDRTEEEIQETGIAH